MIKIPSFAEEIEVYVDDGRLKTDHRFYVSGANFLTLFYEIEVAHGDAASASLS